MPRKFKIAITGAKEDRDGHLCATRATPSAMEDSDIGLREIVGAVWAAPPFTRHRRPRRPALEPDLNYLRAVVRVKTVGRGSR
ncbi:MAG: hypothetical protein IPI20_18645 [Rhodoferax sp.]|nr:hypothetical protein [Rhodoferax sp.]